MSTNVESGAILGGDTIVKGGLQAEHDDDDIDLDAAAGVVDDDDIMEMQHKIQELEDEAERLRQMTEQGGTGDGDGVSDHENAEMTAEQQAAQSQEQDKRSVYVGSVDYGAAPEELQEHFKSCGPIQRITIMVDKYSGHPKGFAYIEFGDEAAVQNALLLNDTMFRGRQLKVLQKRTNLPGYNAKGGKGWGKGSYGL
ncbi:Polyadenylate-binding protein, putative [Perkinsus marinus ATCC 50983]|uniref:Polyadenylate-binding protein, putative n=1 Tax=Perkinsus marinus (strain ATCC 50983 / TXsc) TaxID=423536 RepID=C5LPW3_PERM5|nr:Polyadenylate-binding protein, putative [Perkinsus marinus ATCC 50983]EER01231.1 Polyadenylate-binding protein, putative [Perkinsus marinus ATCC 50983]|eukprot:XP_002768513.1 Polyadenylate-binding protein, putative [Perkinsus marinus ATCC 50983]